MSVPVPAHWLANVGPGGRDHGQRTRQHGRPAGRRRRSHTLNVLINGRHVGHLTRQSDGAIRFAYSPEWLSWEHRFAISISMPLVSAAYTGNDVIAVFDNLLPDAQPIRRAVADRVGADGYDVFSLLAAIGRDCVGALQFRSELDPVDDTPAGSVSIERIDDDQIADLLSRLARAPLGIERDAPFRISIAGAQEKTALFRDDDGWAVPIGATATTHILKPAIGNVDGLDLSTSVENEHFCLALAGELGLPVARSEMQTFGRRRCLIVERFDRQWTRNGRLLRLPQEDFCQALGVPSARKYEAEGGTGLAQMSRILTGSTIVNDREILFRAAVIFWLLAATDGHAKNFSLFLQPGDNFRMTPLYDILSVQPLLDDRSLQRREARMAMAAGRNRHYRLDEIQPRHFEETGEIMGLNRKKVAALLGELADHGSRAAERVSNRLSHCIPDGLRTSIINGMLRRLELINRTWSGI